MPMRATPCFRSLLMLLLLGLVTTALIPHSATAAVTLRGGQLQRQLLTDLQDGHCDDFDLVAAALIAGGVRDNADLQRYSQMFEQKIASLRSRRDSDRETARACLKWLHAELFTGRYQVEYTELSRVLDEGHYNCVAATILYYELSRRADLRPLVMATREHVFVRFVGDRGEAAWDVETTCAEWLDEENQPLLTTPRPRSAARPISPVALLGKVYYNRAVQLLAVDRFQDAIELLQTSIELDPGDEPAQENLLAAINNWALALCRGGEFERAAELIQWGQDLNGHYQPFAANDLHIHQKWTLELCRQARFEEALRLLDAGYQRRPDAAVFDEGRFVVYRRWSEHCFATGDAATAWNVLAVGREQFRADGRWEEYEEGAIHAFLGQLDLDAPQTATTQIEDALSLFPESSLLENALQHLTIGQL